MVRMTMILLQWKERKDVNCFRKWDMWKQLEDIKWNLLLTNIPPSLSQMLLYTLLFSHHGSSITSRQCHQFSKSLKSSLFIELHPLFHFDFYNIFCHFKSRFPQGWNFEVVLTSLIPASDPSRLHIHFLEGYFMRKCFFKLSKSHFTWGLKSTQDISFQWQRIRFHPTALSGSHFHS